MSRIRASRAISSAWPSGTSKKTWTRISIPEDSQVVDGDLVLPLPHVGPVPDQLQHAFAELDQQLRRCAVRDGDLGPEAAVPPGPEVGDVRGGQVGVRDRQERIVEPANARAAEADRLDHALVPADLDQVPHPERAVGDEHQRAEEVLERILRGQGDRKAADPQAGKDRPDVEPEQPEHRGQPRMRRPRS